MPNIFTHNDIARLIGSSRQSVTSLINAMENAGLVKMSNNLLGIPDVKKIQNR